MSRKITNRNKKILYLMICDWNWIKQRPHYLAIELARFYDLTVLYPKLWWAKNIKTDTKNVSPKGLRIKALFTIPKYKTNRVIGFFVNIINKLLIRILFFKNKYDYIWVSHPDQLNLIPKKASLVYDCMDNYCELEKANKRKKIISNNEKKIVNSAKVILTSSDYLNSLIVSKYHPTKSNVVTIRNAYNGKISACKIAQDNQNNIRLCYFGTISDWFDWDVLLDERLKNIEYHIYGPLSSAVIPDDSRIIYHGIASHDELHSLSQKYDAFVMPFKVNELIKAVDPVKMYEYINFNKNIISVWYDEINRFEKFVFFYHDKNEFVSIVETLRKKNELRYSQEERENLLLQNTWSERARCIVELL